MDSLQGVSRVHLVGVGGIGVSALAPALLQRGITVTGSDPATNSVTERLSAQGICVYHDHHADHVRGADLVVATSAAKSNNPELIEAESSGIPVWPRAKMLGALLHDYKSIVVTGAHGKTTITGMLTHVMIDAGLDPTAFIGGDLPILGNSRVGDGEWAVAEGDESDGSFTYLKSDITIVNNIDADHLDFYENLDAIISQFQRFVSAKKPGSILLISADCEASANIAVPDGVRVIRYGFCSGADVQASDYAYRNKLGTSRVVMPSGTEITLSLAISGQYNHHNALSVLAVAHYLNIPMNVVLDSLKRFPGVKRRMEVKGEAAGVRVLDDYAHHPTELRATIAGLRDRYSGRLIGMFQPHLYSRTLQLIDEFSTCFAGLDELVLTDIYAAREAPMEGISGQILFDRVKETGISCRYIENKDEVVEALLPDLRAGDTFITMGAGDGWTVGEALLDRLRERGES